MLEVYHLHPNCADIKSQKFRKPDRTHDNRRMFAQDGCLLSNGTARWPVLLPVGQFCCPPASFAARQPVLLLLGQFCWSLASFAARLASFVARWRTNLLV